MDSLLSSLTLLEEAQIRPEHLDTGSDRNLKLLVESWNYLIDRDPSFNDFREKIGEMTSKEAWERVFSTARL